MQSGKSLPTFWRNALPPSSGLKSNIDKQAASSKHSVWYLLGLLFNTEEESNLFLQNNDKHLLDYMV
jgi:hypothetical protein